MAGSPTTMRTLGLLGGMSWQSTQVYYRLINEGVARRLGGLQSAELLLSSLDMAPLAELQQDGEWEAMGRILAARARALAGAGAEAIVICTNTMHRVAETVMEGLDLPLLHIVDAVADAARSAGHRRLGLLGTRFTMESDLFPARLEGTGLEVLAPPARDDREIVHRIIYEELCRGDVRPASRDAYVQVMERLRDEGCDAVILGCTEIGLLFADRPPAPVPLIDSTAAHAAAAVAFALGGALDARA